MSIFAISLTNSKVRGLGASFLGAGIALRAFLSLERSDLTCFSAFFCSVSLEKPLERVACPRGKEERVLGAILSGTKVGKTKRGKKTNLGKTEVKNDKVNGKGC